MVCIGGTDYNGGRFSACFPIGVFNMSFNVTFVNDEEPPLEMDEVFRINFVSTNPDTTVQFEVFATVTIQDHCTRMCLNGGTLDDTTCKCNCTDLYTGPNCESEFITY